MPIIAVVLALSWSAPAWAQATSPPGGVDLGFGTGVILLTIVAAVVKLTSVVKAAVNHDLNGVVTPLVAIALAFGLFTALAHSDFTPTIPGLDVPIQRASGGTLVLLAVVAGLSAAFGKDWLNARDNTASQAEAPLIGPAHPPNV